MRFVVASLATFSLLAGCSTSETATQHDESAFSTTATVRFTTDDGMQIAGNLRAGRPVRVEYALDRLPQCRDDANGDHPGWSITGFYSENGGPAATFEPTKLSNDGRDRVAAPVTITPSHGGDLAFWFQATSVFGCSAYDSAFGQNFHASVAGPPPNASASIVFAGDGTVVQDGPLKVGGKVKVRYEQNRLPDCRREQLGNPLWTITGFASVAGDEATPFQTGRANGPNREAIDAILELPRSGALELWFQVTNVDGCASYDSNLGQNYTFAIE